MRGKSTSLLAVVIVGLMASFMLIGGNQDNQNTTENDSNSVLDAFNLGDSGVLGVDTSDKSPCPQDSPVIGWIDYRGEKLIVDSIPNDYPPSACFVSDEKAEQEGYKRLD